jgi:hypothetical protein
MCSLVTSLFKPAIDNQRGALFTTKETYESWRIEIKATQSEFPKEKNQILSLPFNSNTQILVFKIF